MPGAILPESAEIRIFAADGQINIRLVGGVEQPLGNRQIAGDVLFFRCNGLCDIGDCE